MEKGLKFDEKKLRYDLIPLEAMEELAKILTYGASKYSDNSWQNLDNFEDRYFAALMRHLIEYRKGNSIDSESNLRHISHVLCNVVFLLYREINNKGD